MAAVRFKYQLPESIIARLHKDRVTVKLYKVHILHTFLHENVFEDLWVNVVDVLNCTSVRLTDIVEFDCKTAGTASPVQTWEKLEDLLLTTVYWPHKTQFIKFTALVTGAANDNLLKNREYQRFVAWLSKTFEPWIELKSGSGHSDDEEDVDSDGTCADNDKRSKVIDGIVRESERLTRTWPHHQPYHRTVASNQYFGSTVLDLNKSGATRLCCIDCENLD